MGAAKSSFSLLSGSLFILVSSILFWLLSLVTTGKVYDIGMFKVESSMPREFEYTSFIVPLLNLILHLLLPTNLIILSKLLSWTYRELGPCSFSVNFLHLAETLDLIIIIFYMLQCLFNLWSFWLCWLAAVQTCALWELSTSVCVSNSELLLLVE